MQADGKRFFKRALAVFLLLSVAQSLSARPALAQSQLKKLVLEDCKQAAAAMQSLKNEDRPEFISYLSRVLKMRTDVSGEALPEGGPNGAHSGPPAPGLDPLRGNISRLFDPSRELEAKQCAAELLSKTAPYSIAVVPEIIETLQDVSLPAELRDSLTRVIWEIIRGAKQRPDFEVESKVFTSLIAELDDQSTSYFAANVLVELYERSVPKLIADLGSPGRKKRDAVNNVLLRIDSSGDLIGPSVLMLLESADDELRLRAISLLARLDGLFNRSLPALIRKLDDPSFDVELAAYRSLDTIFRAPAKLEGVNLEAAVIAELVREIQKPSRDQRQIVERGLKALVHTHAQVVELVLPLAASQDDDLRARALRILGAVEEPNQKIFGAVTDLLFDRSPYVRITAVEVLGVLSGPADDKIAALTKVLKNNSSEKDPAVKQSIVLQAAATVIGLPANASSLRLAPYFVEALAYREARPLPWTTDEGTTRSPRIAADALAHMGKDAVPPVVRALKSEDPIVRSRAIEVLGERAAADPGLLKSLVHMLRDSDTGVRESASSVLVATKADVRSELKKALDWKEPDGQLAAARVLLKLGEKDPKALTLFADAFVKVPCQQKLLLAGDFASLEEDRGRAQTLLLGCMTVDGVDPVAVFQSLGQTLPLDPESSVRVLQLLRERRYPRNVELKLVEKARALGVQSAGIVTQLQLMLKDEDNSVRNYVLVLLGNMGPDAVPAVSQIKELTDDKEQERILRNRAVVALIRIDATQIDAVEYFRKQLEGTKYEQAMTVLSEAPVPIAIPILQKLLHAAPAERLGGVVALIGRLGYEARSLEVELEALVGNSDQVVRYQSTVALLKIDSRSEKVLPAFRRELLGKFGRELLEEQLPPWVKPLAAQVAQNPASFVERRAAEELLRKLETQDRG